MVILKEFFEKVDFEKKSANNKQKHGKLPSLQRVKLHYYMFLLFWTYGAFRHTPCWERFGWWHQLMGFWFIAWKFLTLFLLGNFPCFFAIWFFFKINFPGIPLECQTVWIYIRPDLGLNCLQRLPAGDASRQRFNKIKNIKKGKHAHPKL